MAMDTAAEHKRQGGMPGGGEGLARYKGKPEGQCCRAAHPRTNRCVRFSMTRLGDRKTTNNSLWLKAPSGAK